MANKIAVPNRNAPDIPLLSWGLKLTAVNEVFIITGRPAVAPDGSVVHPNDPVAQTRFILDDVGRYLRENGYTPDDLVRIEYTLTKDVPREKHEAIFALFADFLASAQVKPAASTLRIVDGLYLAGLCVEYEFWAVK